jgi:type IV pilus assembly protein PilA
MKFCTKCGKQNANDSAHCLYCGASFSSTGIGQGGRETQMQPAKTSGLAIASMICGILFLLFPAAIAAIVMGHMSLSQIGKSGGRLTGRGMSIAGLVLGYFGLTVPVMLIIAAIAIPNLVRARTVANESMALASLKSINLSCARYNAVYDTFPESLPNLGVPQQGAISKDAAGLLDGNFQWADGRALTNSGFIFTYVAGPANLQGIIETYSITADPVVPNATGVRRFFVDQSGIVRFTRDGSPPTAESPSLY